MLPFETALQDAIEQKPRLSIRDQRILKVLRAKPSAARARKLARWENAARAQAGIDPTAGAIDWSKIDWAKLLELILSIIAKFFLV